MPRNVVAPTGIEPISQEPESCILSIELRGQDKRDAQRYEKIKRTTSVMLTEWQRLEQIIKWVGMSVNSFGREIGLARSENLYQIKRGNNGISRDLADMICKRYPQISKAWVLAGEGDMFLDPMEISALRLPYFEADVEKYVLAPDSYVRAGELRLPMFAGCDFAAVYCGRAMGDEVPTGSVVVMRRVVDMEELVPGSDCLVVCDKRVLFRRLRASDSSEVLRLEAPDTERVDAVEVNKADVREIYRLEGVISPRKY